jgi:hypothetical protein
MALWSASAVSLAFAGCTLALDTSNLGVPSTGIPCTPTASCVAGHTACCTAGPNESALDHCEPYDAATANTVCTNPDADSLVAVAMLCASPNDCPNAVCCIEPQSVTGMGIRRVVCAESATCGLFESRVCAVDSDCPAGSTCGMNALRSMRFKTCD